MTLVAARAGVSPKTVYLVFPTKSDILAEVIGTAVGGDEASVPLAKRAWFRELLQLKDEQFAAELAAQVTVIHQRAAAVQALGEAAADGDQGLLARRNAARRSRWNLLRSLARSRIKRGGRAEIEDLTDRLYVATSWQSFLMLTHDCGWSIERYLDWLRATLLVTLAHGVADPSGPAAKRGLRRFTSQGVTSMAGSGRAMQHP